MTGNEPEQNTTHVEHDHHPHPDEATGVSLWLSSPVLVAIIGFLGIMYINKRKRCRETMKRKRDEMDRRADD